MVRIAPETDADHAAVDALVEAAFGQRDEADLVAALRATDAYLPALALVARTDDVVVGHILFTRVHVEPGREEGLALAPMAVRPGWQGRGVGAALLRAGLEEAERSGERFVVVLGHPGYYPRFGFVPARPSGLACPYAGVPDEAWLALALDGRPLPTGTVRYADPLQPREASRG